VVVHGFCVLGFGVVVFGRAWGLLGVHVAASKDFGGHVDGMWFYCCLSVGCVISSETGD